MLAKGQTLLYENDFTGITEFTGWSLFDDSQTDGKIDIDPDGVAITVGIQTGQLWQPEIMVVPDGSFNLEEGSKYTIVVTAKFPEDGTLQINMGTWSANDQAQFPVEATGDFQDVVCEFSDWSVDAEGAHLLFQCGDFKGTTILKYIEIWKGDALIRDKWCVAGDEDLLGVDWDATKNKMFSNDDEHYKLIKRDIMLSKGTYHYKVVKGDESYPNTNASLVIDEDGIYTVTFSFNANTKEVSATAIKTYVWTVAGDESLMGADWDPTTNKMRNDDGINYSLKKTELMLSKGTYGFKVFKDYASAESYPNSNASLVIEEDATYTVVFSFNANTKEVSATATKTDGIYYNYIPKGNVAEVIQNPNNYKGNIIIPEKVTHEGVEYTVIKIGDNAFNDCSGLASVTIPNSVTSIGDGAFNKCSGLTFITIPNSVTSIGYSAFEGCSGLTSFTIPNSVKSIGYGAFYNCNSLTSVAFPNSFITLGSSVFEHCGNLKHVYISDLDIWCNMNSNETIIHYPHHIYLNGEEIINLTIPSSITSISFAFANCAFIESINIGSSVTSIDGAFSNCTSLTSIDIPSNVTSIGVNAFNGCTSLSSIKLPSNLTSIGGGAFAGCTSLSSINLPSNLTSIGGSAFAGCTSLLSIDIPLNVTYIEVAAFEGCKSLTTVTIPNSVTNIRREVFQNCAKLENVYCMIEDLSSLSIGSSVFDGSYIEYATLHVPASAINVYKTTAPWSGFGEFKTLSGEAIETKKCTTPTISFENGEIIFSCETEGVEYISNITAPDAKAYYDGRIKPTYKYTVSVYATKAGCLNSDTATAEFSATGVFGDLNGDGKVNVADHVKLSSIIMNEE